MQCSSDKCEETAEFKIFWPGEPPSPKCFKCNAKAQGIADVLGFHLVSQELGLPSLEEIHQTLARMGK